jgi:hypothetical protein
MDGETKIDGLKDISAGDTIEIIVDFDANKVTFRNNNQFVGVMSPKAVKLAEGKLYFCANLSVGSEVQLINSPSAANTSTSQPQATHPKTSPNAYTPNTHAQQPATSHAPTPHPTTACPKVILYH